MHIFTNHNPASTRCEYSFVIDGLDYTLWEVEIDKIGKHLQPRLLS